MGKGKAKRTAARRKTSDPGAGDLPQFAAPATGDAKTLRIAGGAGLPPPLTVHPHRNRAGRRARGAR